MPTVSEIASSLGRTDRLQLLGSSGTDVVERPAALSAATAGSVAFCGHTAREPQLALAQTSASLLLVDDAVLLDRDALRRQGVKALISSPNARLDFVRTITRFFAPPRPTGVHKTAFVEPGTSVPQTAFIGPLATIGRDVRIGENTVIHAGVHVYDRVTIGQRVTIHAGTVIGADGFGYEKNETGGMELFPHLGGVWVEDDVEIGANSCIDRGALGDTRIRRGARIDNLVHIAHNVDVGEDAVVIAHAMIGGSVRIGARAWLAPSACVRDRLTIGEDAVVGLASLVTRDVPARTTVFGVPARPYVKDRA